MYIENDLNVRIGDVLTKSFHLERGVRQGDNLSPNLFKICVNDLPTIFNGDDAPVDLNCSNVNCLLYADDLILLSRTEEGLQSCLNKLSKYCDEYGLSVNLKKIN